MGGKENPAPRGGGGGGGGGGGLCGGGKEKSLSGAGAAQRLVPLTPQGGKSPARYGTSGIKRKTLNAKGYCGIDPHEKSAKGSERLNWEGGEEKS